MNTDKDFVPYQPSLDMKEIGFDEPCFVKIWWLNDFNVHTKEQFEPHITMNGDDIKFKYQFPENHPLNKGDILKLEIPTFSQAFRWFREKYNLDSFVKELYKSTIKVGYYFGIDEYKGIEFQMDFDDYYKTYEEAELACLEKLIKICKNK